MSGTERRPDANRASPRWSAVGPALMAALLATGLGFAGPTWAQTTEDTTHHDGGGKGMGSGGGGGAKAGSHEDGHDDGHTGEDQEGGHDQCGPDGADGQDTGSPGCGPGGQGQGGHEGSEGAGKGAQGSAGPVWSREGIPEVELGRLNVARSPTNVLNRAYAEALGSMTPQVLSFYKLPLAQMVDKLRNEWGTVEIVESPVQNLALFRDALDGTSVLSTAGVTTDNDTLLAAFLGAASDKTIPITTDTVRAISTILGQPLGDQKAEEIAQMAEQIRIAILAGHG